MKLSGQRCFWGVAAVLAVGCARTPVVVTPQAAQPNPIPATGTYALQAVDQKKASDSQKVAHDDVKKAVPAASSEGHPSSGTQASGSHTTGSQTTGNRTGGSQTSGSRGSHGGGSRTGGGHTGGSHPTTGHPNGSHPTTGGRQGGGGGHAGGKGNFQNSHWGKGGGHHRAWDNNWSGQWGSGSWWGDYGFSPWWGLGLQPSWWGTVSLTSNQFVLENGYYYPFYLYGDVVYPDYATPYASQAGMFVPVSYDLALSNISAAPIPVSAAQIVSVDPSLVQQ